MKLKTLAYTLILASGVATLLASCDNKAGIDPVARSKADFSLCNVGNMAQQFMATPAMKQKYDVGYLNDADANYSYYSVASRGEVNADSMRGVVCQFVM